MPGKRSRIVVILLSFILLVTSAFRVAVADQQNLSVTATVPANSNSFPVTLTQDTAGTRFPQDTELAYTITYGSRLTGVVDLTLVASWSRGTIQGDPSPTLDILDYVPGSASTAANSTPPVIDTVNRTITWSITAFPANTTNATVTFHLKTNHSYTGNSVVNFHVDAQSHGAAADSAISTVSKEYKYDISLVPTSTPTPTLTPTTTPTPTSGAGPSATPQPQATSTPTPTPLPSQQTFRFTDISLETIVPDSASVRIQTSQESTITLVYGTSMTTMSEKLTDLSAIKNHLLPISGLKENTRYYFRITAKNVQNKAISSDIYTFVTGKTGEVPLINRDRTIITSEHLLLYPSSNGVFVLPRNTNYELNLVFTNPAVVRRVALLVRNPNVLGVNTISVPSATNSSGGETKEISPGRYALRLATPNGAGIYSLDTRVSDTNGNILDTNLGSLKVIDFMSVINKTTGQPIEHARVKLSLYNYRTQRYELISPQILPIQNPAYSEPDGTVRIVLPQGKYRAEVSTIIDKNTQVDFTIGPNTLEEFPVVRLEREPFSVISFIRYQWETCQDVLASLKELLLKFAESLRLFALNAYLLLLTSVAMTYVGFSRRIRIPLHNFIHHFAHRAKGSYFSAAVRKRVEGIITDAQSKTPISGADIFLIVPRNNAVIAHAKSAANGAFGFNVYDTHSYIIEVMKDEYAPNRFHEDTLTAADKGYMLKLRKKPDYHATRSAVIEGVLSMSFEAFLILSFIMETLFVYVFGWTKTLPFILLSLLNLFLMLVHHVQREE